MNLNHIHLISHHYIDTLPLTFATLFCTFYLPCFLLLSISPFKLSNAGFWKFFFSLCFWKLHILLFLKVTHSIEIFQIVRSSLLKFVIILFSISRSFLRISMCISSFDRSGNLLLCNKLPQTLRVWNNKSSYISHGFCGFRNLGKPRPACSGSCSHMWLEHLGLARHLSLFT